MYEKYWAGVPPKSTFQPRNKNFVKTPAARLAFAQWQAILERFIPDKPFEGPLEFRLVLTWPTLKGMKGTRFKTTRPDGCNILKGVEDIMTRLGYWHDDNQLAIESIERYYGDFPGVFFQIKELHQQ